jgi:hypothetical protein
VKPRRRRQRAEPFLTLLKAIIYGENLRVPRTCWARPTRPSIGGWCISGFPTGVVGPEVDYYDRVAPHLMSLSELDRVILSRHFVALDGFLMGRDPDHWPRRREDEDAIAPTLAEGPLPLGDRRIP